MKTLITTTLALGVIFTLCNQAVEARHVYYYDAAPGYAYYGPGYAYGPGYGYGYYNRGLVPNILGNIFGY